MRRDGECLVVEAVLIFSGKQFGTDLTHVQQARWPQALAGSNTVRTNFLIFIREPSSLALRVACQQPFKIGAAKFLQCRRVGDDDIAFLGLGDAGRLRAGLARHLDQAHIRHTACEGRRG